MFSSNASQSLCIFFVLTYILLTHSKKKELSPQTFTVAPLLLLGSVHSIFKILSTVQLFTMKRLGYRRKVWLSLLGSSCCRSNKRPTVCANHHIKKKLKWAAAERFSIFTLFWEFLQSCLQIWGFISV